MNKPTKSKRLALRQFPSNEFNIMKHKWRDLLFFHWEYDPVEIQKTLPPGLFVDTFNDKAYIGITPFFLFDVRPVFLPAIPVLSDFLEVNVRTYVYDKNGTPGVWFYSLDATQPVAVKLAQQLFLPYHNAEITGEKNSFDEIHFNIIRKNTPISLSSDFRGIHEEEEFFADSEQLDFFLIERYLLFCYNYSSQKLFSIRVHHEPYPLKKLKVINYDTNLLKLNGFSNLINPLVHTIYSPGVDVDIFIIKKNN